MFVSVIFGCIIGIFSWILGTILLYGGFDLDTSGEFKFCEIKMYGYILTKTDWFKGRLISMLIGNAASLLSGGLLVVILTFITSNRLNVDQKLEIWEKTRDIDSPLCPWYEIYAK